jgi:hypothetical protein
MLKKAARLANDGPKLEHDGLEVSVDPLAASNLQSAE